MKAFHFTLIGGERGTLAGCPDEMTIEQAMEALNFQFPERLDEVYRAGRMLNAALKCPTIEPLKMTHPSELESFDGGICSQGPQHGPLLLMNELNLKCPPAG